MHNYCASQEYTVESAVHSLVLHFHCYRCYELFTRYEQRGFFN